MACASTCRRTTDVVSSDGARSPASSSSNSGLNSAQMNSRRSLYVPYFGLMNAQT